MKHDAAKERKRGTVPKPEKYVFELYVTGASPNSVRAIANLRSICEKSVLNGYSLKIIDVYQHPQLAAKIQIYALPMLIKKLPLPERKFVGDLSETEKVLRGLGL